MPATIPSPWPHLDKRTGDLRSIHKKHTHVEFASGGLNLQQYASCRLTRRAADGFNVQRNLLLVSILCGCNLDVGLEIHDHPALGCFVGKVDLAVDQSWGALVRI